MAISDSVDDLRNYLNDSATMTAEAQLRNYFRTTSVLLAPECPPLQVSLAEAANYLGLQVGLSNWHSIAQQQSDAINGGSAVGMQILLLLPALATQGTLKLQGTRQSIIYGLDQVRFLNPTRYGTRVRGRFVLQKLQQLNNHEVLLRHSACIEIENEDEPALIADWIEVAVL
jgi:hypothetical protein